MEYHVDIREEEGAYWGEVRELPGCFASGMTLDELKEAVTEAIGLYLDETGRAAARVDELRLVTA